MEEQMPPSPQITTLLKTNKAWNGSEYRSYPEGEPELTLLHVVVPPNTKLDAHWHPSPSAGYMIRGALYLQPLDGSKQMVLLPGNGCPEMQDIPHYGYTKEERAEFVVFFAGSKGTPLTVPFKTEESDKG